MNYEKLKRFLSTYKKCSYVNILYKIDVSSKKAKAFRCSVNKIVKATIRIGLNYDETKEDWFSKTDVCGIVKNNSDDSKLYLLAFLSPNKPRVNYAMNGMWENKKFLVNYGYLDVNKSLYHNSEMFTLNIDNIIKIGKEVK